MKKLCIIPDCDRPTVARGFCNMHYRIARESGMDVLPRMSIEDRFWQKVDRSGTCWIWTAYRDRLGYGQFNAGDRLSSAHRFAYELISGPIGDGLVIDHLCRNPSCVNPEHLEAVPQRENVLRGESPIAKQARQAKCIRGHALSGDNLIWTEGGRKRRCRACRLMWNRLRSAS